LQLQVKSNAFKAQQHWQDRQLPITH